MKSSEHPETPPNKWALNAIAREQKRRVVLYLIILLLVITSSVGPFLVFLAVKGELRKPQKVALIDPAGNLFVSPLSDVDQSEELVFWCGQAAANAMLSRRPSGFDFPGVVDLVFRGEALKKLKTEIEAFRKEAEKNELHWKLELKKIEPIASRDPNTKLVKITGAVVELAHFGAVYEQRPRTFELGLKMTKNGEVLTAGRFPYVVETYNIKLSE
jgi:hypothetical protein